jgi:hypothetical protein
MNIALCKLSIWRCSGRKKYKWFLNKNIFKIRLKNKIGSENQIFAVYGDRGIGIRTCKVTYQAMYFAYMKLFV